MSRPPPLTADDAVLLDFDGTLVDLAERPTLVRVPKDLPALLAATSAARGEALAIVSGRRLASIDEMLAPMRFSGAGLHGAELRTDPRETAPPPEPLLASAALRLAALLQDDPVAWIEDKGAAIALHFRGAPERAEEMRRALREAVAGCEVEIIAGKCVFEARPRGVDKGVAVRQLMQRAPFQGRRPIYVGDDVTDEDGIVAAQALGGFGIKVGEGVSAAAWRLPSPAAVRQWLAGFGADPSGTAH